MTREELWEGLCAASLAHGSMPTRTSPAAPWYVSAMVGVAAWIASLFLLVFVGIALAGILRGAAGAVAVGAMLCAACAVAMRTWRDRLFAEQFAVAASLVGQALLAYGILEGNWRSPLGWLVVAAIEALLVVAAPVYVHRVIATIAAAYAVRFALAHAGLGVLFSPLVAGALVLAWSAARKRVSSESLWRPVTAGLSLAALLVVPATIVDALAWQVRAAPVGGVVLAWFATFALAGVLLAAIAGLLRETGVGFQSRPALLAFAAGAAVALAARPLPGLVVALIVLLLAFSEGRRALMGLGIAGLIAALVHYYYALDATLLTKAAALFAAGVVLVVSGLAVRLGLADTESRHA